jgi:hypothetical protein
MGDDSVHCDATGYGEEMTWAITLKLSDDSRTLQGIWTTIVGLLILTEYEAGLGRGRLYRGYSASATSGP